jgi:NADP-dependent 3-hydroxy acid dehydrogenase YdfG
VTNTETQPRVAVVTGASSGIREATARALASDGYRVALLARRLDRITALAGELGDGCVAIQADVTDRDGIVAAAERVRKRLGGADVLVNNAGIMLLGPFDTDQREDYRLMIEVNLLGAVTATEVFLDQLKDGAGHRGSDIVNSSSVAGRTARAGNGVYAATKGGSTAGRSRCDRSCSPTYGSRSSNPASSRPSCPSTSPTTKPARASSSSTARPRSPPGTSPT